MKQKNAHRQHSITGLQFSGGNFTPLPLKKLRKNKTKVLIEMSQNIGITCSAHCIFHKQNSVIRVKKFDG
jgi:hypothetical protein